MNLFRLTTSRPQDPGFTLLELLAVVVLLSLTFTVTGVRLAATSTRAKLQATASRLRDLDAHTRLLARSGEPASLRLDGTQRHVNVQGIRSTELLATVTLPAEVTVQVRASSGDETITFDRLGRSKDYRVTVQAGETVLRWHVYGLTGYIRTDGPGANP